MLVKLNCSSVFHLNHVSNHHHKSIAIGCIVKARSPPLLPTDSSPTLSVYRIEGGGGYGISCMSLHSSVLYTKKGEGNLRIPIKYAVRTQRHARKCNELFTTRKKLLTAPCLMCNKEKTKRRSPLIPTLHYVHQQRKHADALRYKLSWVSIQIANERSRKPNCSIDSQH